jgi:hypothetical protein
MAGSGCACRSSRGGRYCDTLENRNGAQRAPSARPGLSAPFRECARSPWVLIVKSDDFPVEFDEGDGLKNRCRERKKNAID